MRSTYNISLKSNSMKFLNIMALDVLVGVIIIMDMSELILGGLLYVKHILYFTICFC